MKVTICIGSFCHVKGAPQVIAELQRLVAEHNLKDKVELAGKFCMGRCQSGPIAWMRISGRWRRSSTR